MICYAGVSTYCQCDIKETRNAHNALRHWHYKCSFGHRYVLGENNFKTGISGLLVVKI
jgi:hypothetical protein